MEIGLLIAGLTVDGPSGFDPAAIAADAEARSYDTIWVGELWGESGVVQLAEIARRTEEIGIGSAVLNVYSRTPAVLAMTAATLQRASDGRFTLGTGVTTPTAVENLHGMSYDRPVRRAHETIEIVNMLTSEREDSVSYDGELLSVTDVSTLNTPVPIYHAGLGPANRRVIGRLCDGWIPHMLPFSGLEDAFEEVETAARDRDRDPDEISVAPFVPSAVSEDPSEAREVLRRHIAYYVGSAKGYRNAVATAFPEEAEQIADAWQRGDRGAAAESVTDDLVDDLGVAGTPEDARQRLRELYESPIVDHPIVIIPSPSSDETAEATIEALAPNAF